MIWLFNRRFLCKCKSVDKRNKVCNALTANNIAFVCKTKGMNLRFAENLSDIFWFNIYVCKKDFEKARMLAQTDSSDINVREASGKK